jgi:glycosyltransferase involved in cell wall biosynthesis
MVKEIPSWICCQLGAREHYAIPRAFHREGQLAHLITDAWIPPHAILNQLPKSYLTNLRERFHPDLEQASVRGFTVSLLRFELAQKVQKISEWELIIARNNWFQNCAIQHLETLKTQFFNFKHRPILFAYSYAALKLFRYAKTQGWYTVLGQIDPGLVEEKLVLEEHNKYPMYASNWQPAPPCYWHNWQEECRLADRIVVNSLWSSQAIQQAGVPESKIDIIPLAYEPPPQARHFLRVYPLAFSVKRPLRVLFLGQVILRKGIAALLEAAEILCNQPIEFWLVGSQGIDKSKLSSSQ